MLSGLRYTEIAVSRTSVFIQQALKMYFDRLNGGIIIHFQLTESRQEAYSAAGTAIKDLGSDLKLQVGVKVL